MTTYAQAEASTHDGQPIECYLFVGARKTYRYTSHDVPVTMLGQLFTPLPLQRSDLEIGTHEDDGAQLRITMPITTDIVIDYGFQITPPRLEVTIYRGHLGTDLGVEIAQFWRGRVSSVTVKNQEATLNVPSLLAVALGTHLPGVYHQAPCNHTLFDAGCGLNRADWTITTVVTGIKDNTVSISTMGGWPNEAFVGGEIVDLQYGDRRTIVAQLGTTLTLNYPFLRDIQLGLVEVTLGCDHAFTGDCKQVFSNQERHGGDPFVPFNNPFVTGI